MTSGSAADAVSSKLPFVNLAGRGGTKLVSGTSPSLPLSLFTIQQRAGRKAILVVLRDNVVSRREQ